MNFLEIDDVAQRLHCSKSYLYKLTSTQSIPFYKLGKKILFDPDEIEMWFHKNFRVEPVRS